MRRPKSRLIAAPPISTGNGSARSCSSCTHSGICFEVETSSAERPIAVASVLLRGVEDRRDRHLLAEVDDRVAVVREDRVDERLADVVHVAEDGRDHDRALRVALDAVEVVLQPRDGLLHHLGATGARTGGSARRRRTCRRPPSSPAAARRSASGPRRSSRPTCRSSPRRRPSCGAGCGSAAPPRAPCRRSGRPSPPRRDSPFSSKCSMKRCVASSRLLKTRSSARSRSTCGISA